MLNVIDLVPGERPDFRKVSYIGSAQYLVISLHGHLIFDILAQYLMLVSKSFYIGVSFEGKW